MKIRTLMNALNSFIDDRIDMYGYRLTVEYLLDLGLSNEDFEYLNFDTEEDDFKRIVDDYNKYNRE